MGYKYKVASFRNTSKLVSKVKHNYLTIVLKYSN